jgi:hypothetical protein
MAADRPGHAAPRNHRLPRLDRCPQAHTTADLGPRRHPRRTRPRRGGLLEARPPTATRTRHRHHRSHRRQLRAPLRPTAVPRRGDDTQPGARPRRLPIDPLRNRRRRNRRAPCGIRAHPPRCTPPTHQHRRAARQHLVVPRPPARSTDHPGTVRPAPRPTRNRLPNRPPRRDAATGHHRARGCARRPARHTHHHGRRLGARSRGRLVPLRRRDRANPGGGRNPRWMSSSSPASV